MTSWINTPSKQMNIGYRQVLPEGKFSAENGSVTVVSAFYIMNSRHTFDEYKRRIRLFLENVPCNLIFYTEELLVPFIRECRRAYEDNTDVIVIPRNEWIANKRFPKTVWDDLKKLDTSENSTDLYKLHYEKKEFMKKAIAANPFGDKNYMWINAGICKTPDIMNLIKGRFPVSSRIPTDKVMLYNITPFDYSDEKVRVYGSEIILGVRNKNRICSNIIVGSKERWLEFSNLYDTTIGKFIRAKLFWGLDQPILACLTVENKVNISLIEYKNIVPDEWRSEYALLYLGCSDSLYKFLRDSSSKKKSQEDIFPLAQIQIPENTCTDSKCQSCGR
jgi:hypothetical protein